MLGSVEYHALFVDGTLHIGATPRCSVLDVSPLMREIIQALSESYSPDSRRQQMMMDLLVEEISSAEKRSVALPMPSERRLRALCDALLEDVGSTHSLADWARKIGASERTLARLFQTELNTTFSAWRQQARLSHAVDMISRGTPMLTVATELGYSDTAAFSTMFKRAFGSTPSQFKATRALPGHQV
ncbi:AraC family transcriptional regulator [Paraburkholderia sp. JPY465]|uniref:AraC family transcriptional regulator n=1 Tax=Paraburkholderia sp. JPY465 TaxID=3042285 RepID=UPI003D20407F